MMLPEFGQVIGCC